MCLYHQSECKAKHGPVFTLVVAGQRMTMICDSSASSKFFRHNRLDFERFGYGVSEKAFGHTFQGSMAVAKTSKPLTTKNLLGSGLPALQVAFAKELYSLLGLPSSKVFLLCASHRQPTVSTPVSVYCQQKRDGLEQVQKLENGSWSLYDFISVLVFGSSTEALWGNGFYNAAVLDDFRSVDDAFILLIAGVPSFGIVCSVLTYMYTFTVHVGLISYQFDFHQFQLSKKLNRRELGLPLISADRHPVEPSPVPTSLTT